MKKVLFDDHNRILQDQSGVFVGTPQMVVQTPSQPQATVVNQQPGYIVNQQPQVVAAPNINAITHPNGQQVTNAQGQTFVIANPAQPQVVQQQPQVVQQPQFIVAQPQQPQVIVAQPQQPQTQQVITVQPQQVVQPQQPQVQQSQTINPIANWIHQNIPGTNNIDPVKAAENFAQKLFPFGKREADVSKDSKENVGVCLGCPPGAFLDHIDDGTTKCSSCPEFCRGCSTGGCMTCIPGYFIAEVNDDKVCTKCTLENCKACKNSNYCYSCADGFHRDQDGKCQKCDSTCLSCNGPGPTQCTSCPINKYKFQIENGQKVIFPSDPLSMLHRLPFSGVFGAHYKCLDKCPTRISEFNVREEIFIDEFSKSCVFKPEYDHNRYTFSTMQNMLFRLDALRNDPKKNLLEGITFFWERYQVY